jgi:hypothetical protein
MLWFGMGPFFLGTRIYEDWINQQMDEGCTILDCGAAPGRANFPDPTSPYYQVELDQIQRRAYPYYQSIPAIGD